MLHMDFWRARSLDLLAINCCFEFVQKYVNRIAFIYLFIDDRIANDAEIEFCFPQEIPFGFNSVAMRCSRRRWRRRMSMHLSSTESDRSLVASELWFIWICIELWCTKRVRCVLRCTMTLLMRKCKMHLNVRTGDRNEIASAVLCAKTLSSQWSQVHRIRISYVVPLVNEKFQ